MVSDTVETPDRSSRLDESSSSVAFVSLLFTISLAVLALAFDAIKTMTVLAVPLFGSIIACFYSAVAYAMIAGEHRTGDDKKAMRGLLLGNLLSEWFGVYALIILFAPIVGALSPKFPPQPTPNAACGGLRHSGRFSAWLFQLTS